MPYDHSNTMLEKLEFLEEVERKAKTRAAMAAAISVAPPRITEMFTGKRRLYYDEAVTLARTFGIEDERVPSQLNEEVLAVVEGVVANLMVRDGRDEIDAESLGRLARQAVQIALAPEGASDIQTRSRMASHAAWTLRPTAKPS